MSFDDAVSIRDSGNLMNGQVRRVMLGAGETVNLKMM